MNPCRIFIVEDEAIVAMDIENRLAAMGYQLAGRAASGENALVFAERERPNLVLMDIRLQGAMDGIEAAEEIRRRFHLPVIFLTAYSEQSTLDRAKLAEPFGYLLKPFDDRELRSAIEIALYKHRTEEEIRRLNSFYDVLSQVNQAIVHARSREGLLPTACRLIVERGNVDLAWIGQLNPDTSLIRPVAYFGNRTEMLNEADFYADERPEGQGNPGKAIREGTPQVCQECDDSTCSYPASKAPGRFGFHSCGSFPLRFQGEMWGTLNLCVTEGGFFREREVELLEKVAIDISFALDKLEQDLQRKLAEQALADETTWRRILVEQSGDGIVVLDQNGKVYEANQQYADMLGYTTEEMRQLHVWDWDTQFTPEELTERIRLYDSTSEHFQARHRRKDGIFIDVEVSSNGAVIGGEKLVFCVTRDISRRRQAEVAQQESNDRLTLALAASRMGVWEWDITTDRVSWSAESCSIVGTEQSSQSFESFRNSIHPEDTKRVVTAAKQALANRAVYAAEFRVVRANGEVRWFSNYGQGKYSDDGRPLRLVGTVLDITERKQAEDTLRISRGQLAEAADLARIAYYNVDLVNHEFIFNDPFYALLATTAEQEGGYRMPVAEYGRRFVHPEDLPLFTNREEGNKDKAGKTDVTTLEHRAIRRDGEIIHLLNRSRVVRDADGRLEDVYGVNQDITERRAAEQLLKNIFSSSPTAIFLLQDMRFQLVNAQAVLVTGYGEEELVGMDALTIISPRDRDTVLGNLKRLSEGVNLPPRELQWVRKDGRLRWAMVMTTIIEYQGRPAVLVNSMDITDRKLLESQLVQAQKLESIGQLAAGIAHEINTPIQYVGDNLLFLKDSFGDIITLTHLRDQFLESAKKNPMCHGLADALEESTAEVDLPYLESEIPKAIEQSLEGVERVANIVRAMKEFSHPGTKGKTLVDVNRALQNTITVSRNEWKYVSDVVTEFDRDLPLVPCLPGEFNQVILNIIINAAQAIAEKNGTAQEKGSIRISTLNKDGWAEINIRDTGSGIPADIQSRVFDPFFTTKDVGKGTGQGLAIARSIIVDKHGGDISFETEAGVGTTFTIRLPLGTEATL